MRRRLAAILAADVVGYSRLMGENAERTLAALQQFRAEIFGPIIAGHGGRLIKSMGDGWLVEFGTTVDAVSCALQVQERLAGIPGLNLRIGVHIGDVIHADEDIFGDAVNIAARLQELADPGSVAISGSAYESLDGTLAPGFTDAGLHALKNIARPVEVWTRGVRPVEAAARAMSSTSTSARIFPVLAIMPLSRDDTRSKVHDLADALVGDLEASLASSDWLRPIITSHPRPRAYILDSSLRSMGDLLRLELRLASPDGETLWRRHYDGSLADSFDWRDQVAREVAADIFGAILDTERQRLFSIEEGAMSAADHLLCGVLEFYEVSHEALTSALSHLERAIEKDPDEGTAYVHALRCIFAAVAAGYRHAIAEYLQNVPALLAAAHRLSGENPLVTVCAAIWDYRQNRKIDALQATVEDALRRAPFDPDVLCLGGWCYVWLGMPERAIDCFGKFAGPGPFNSLSMAVRGGLAVACVQMGRDQAAIEHAAAVIRTTSDFSVPYRATAAAAGHLGDRALGREAIANLQRLVRDEALGLLRMRSGFADTPANARLFDGLRKAGLPE